MAPSLSYYSPLLHPLPIVPHGDFEGSGSHAAAVDVVGKGLNSAEMCQEVMARLSAVTKNDLSPMRIQPYERVPLQLWKLKVSCYYKLKLMIRAKSSQVFFFLVVAVIVWQVSHALIADGDREQDRSKDIGTLKAKVEEQEFKKDCLVVSHAPEDGALAGEATIPQPFA